MPDLGLPSASVVAPTCVHLYLTRSLGWPSSRFPLDVHPLAAMSLQAR